MVVKNYLKNSSTAFEILDVDLLFGFNHSVM